MHIQDDQNYARKPPLPIYQQRKQLQNALDLVVGDSSPNKSDKRDQSIINVFTENSHINEERLRLNIYNPYFR